MFVLKNPAKFPRMQNMGCGPLAARWALGVLGKKWPYDKSLEYKTVSPDKMMKTIASGGIRAEIVYFSDFPDSDLSDKMKLKSLVRRGRPVPILVKIRYFPHWVVVAGFDEKGFYLFDSNLTDDTNMAVGNLYVTKAELLRIRMARFFVVVWYTAVMKKDLSPTTGMKAPDLANFYLLG